MPLASDIMKRAGVQLLDEDHVRWTLAELADWVNEAVRAIILVKPSAASKSIVLPLAVGTLQRVPTDGDVTALALLRIVRNLKTSAETPRVGGRAVRVTDRDLLDGQDPNWHDSTKTPYKAEVRQFAFDSINPLEFYVYPGNNGSGIVEAVVSHSPIPVAAADGADQKKLETWEIDIGLPEPYSVPVLDYVLYRAQIKDDTAGNAGRATLHYQQFASALGIKVQVERVSNPNAAKAP